MEISPFVLSDSVLLSVPLGDGQQPKLAFWSERLAAWTTSEQEATTFESHAAAVEYLALNRKKMEAAFLKRSGSNWFGDTSGASSF